MQRREFIKLIARCGGSVATRGAGTTTGKIAAYWRAGVRVTSASVC